MHSNESHGDESTSEGSWSSSSTVVAELRTVVVLMCFKNEGPGSLYLNIYDSEKGNLRVHGELHGSWEGGAGCRLV